MADDTTTLETTEQTTEPVTTPPVSSPPVTPASPPSIDAAALRAELASLQGNIVTEQAQRIMDLQAELLAKNSTPAAPADDATRFLESPRQMIREELQSVVQPLIEFMGGIKKNDAYSNLKNECKRHATLGPLLTRVESIVDQVMANSEPTPQNLQAAIFTALGIEAAGLANTNTTPPTPPPTAPSQPVSTTPPYIPPSPPAPPRSSNNPADNVKAKVAALTETERDVAKRWGISLEQYVINRDADENASSWKGGTNV